MLLLLRFKCFIFIGLLLVFLFSSCRNKLSKEQGEKHLKAFDSELITMMKQLSETNAFNAFDFLLSYNNLPLPFKYPQHNSKGIP